MDHISVIRDPRQAWKIEHTLTDIIFLTIAAVKTKYRTPMYLTFGEDASRKRAEEGAGNFVRTMQTCSSMLKNETTLKASIKHKRAMCAMNCEYLLKVLASLY
nr:hypothetical protein [Vibrio cyclitrophicus]